MVVDLATVGRFRGLRPPSRNWFILSR